METIGAGAVYHDHRAVLLSHNSTPTG